MAEDSQGQAPDYDGYASLDELKRAKRASGDEAKRLADENRRLAEQVQAMERNFQQSQQRQAVPQRGTPYERMREFGIPDDAIREAIREEAGSLVREAFQPIALGMQARTQMLAEHPDYAEHESQVASFVQSDPKVKERYERMFSVDPLAANEYAYLKYGETQKGRRRNESQRGEELRRETMAHAAIPSERSGQTRQERQPDQMVEDARKRMIDSGHTKASVEDFARARLHTVITDEFLNQ